MVRLPKDWKEFTAENKACERQGRGLDLECPVCSGKLPVTYRSG